MNKRGLIDSFTKSSLLNLIIWIGCLYLKHTECYYYSILYSIWGAQLICMRTYTISVSDASYFIIMMGWKPHSLWLDSLDHTQNNDPIGIKQDRNWIITSTYIYIVYPFTRGLKSYILGKISAHYDQISNSYSVYLANKLPRTIQTGRSRNYFNQNF